MSTLISVLIALAALIGLSFNRASLRTSAITLAGVTVFSIIAGASFFLNLMLLVAVIITALLSIDDLRQKHLSKPIFAWFKKVLPEISQTEREAIDASGCTNAGNWRADFLSF